MAERRMFAKTIIDSDVFLDMPLSTQALYFHLSMRADDEGFINNPRKVLRMIGAATNELDILIVKRFLLSFDTGVVVIKHWKIHNYIQKDRFKKTLYKEERSQLSENEDKIYSDNIRTLDTQCIQIGDAGKSKVSKELDKSKNSIVKTIKEVKHKHGEYKKVLLTDKQYDSLKDNWGLEELNRMIKILDESMEMNPKYKYSNFKIALTKWRNNSFNSPTNSKPDKWRGEQNFDF